MKYILFSTSLLLALALNSCQSEPQAQAQAQAAPKSPVAQAAAVQVPVEQQIPTQVHTPDTFALEWQSAPEGALLLDVRTPREFALGALEGAQNWDVQDPEFEARFADIAPETPVFVYCARGGRSARAAKKLRYLGFQVVHDMAGGFTAWQSAGLPVSE